ncbi:MAG: RHS repeat domain-containing protein, partial [Spirochaetota bacterium]
MIIFFVCYDLNSNVTKITYPDGKQVTYTYDAKDRMKTVKDWNNNTTTYNYLDDNRLSSVVYPNGILTTYTYDVAGRMTAMETKDGNTIICSY